MENPAAVQSKKFVKIQSTDSLCYSLSHVMGFQKDLLSDEQNKKRNELKMKSKYEQYVVYFPASVIVLPH